MLRSVQVAAVTVLALVSGCSGGDTADGAAPAASATSSPSPAAAATGAGAGDGSLPAALIGTFADPSDFHYTFHPAGHDFCAERAAAEGACYAVREGADPSAEPVEYGAAAAEGDVLELTVVEDPKAGCVGVTNRLRWQAAGDSVTLTPIEDCHGSQPLVLTRA